MTQMTTSSPVRPRRTRIKSAGKPAEWSQPMCFGGNNSCIWIILIIIVLCCCCGNGNGNGCGNDNGCGCGC